MELDPVSRVSAVLRLRRRGVRARGGPRIAAPRLRAELGVKSGAARAWSRHGARPSFARIRGPSATSSRRSCARWTSDCRASTTRRARGEVWSGARMVSSWSSTQFRAYPRSFGYVVEAFVRAVDLGLPRLDYAPSSG